MKHASGGADELAQILSAGPQGLHRRRFWLVAAGGVAILAGVLLWLSGDGKDSVQYRTEALRRGDLVVTVSATGNLQPTNQVDVGSELSGTIEAVFVDDNDVVTKSQVLARLDTTKLQNQLTQSRASLKAAQARVLEAAASVEEARANLARLRHVAELSGGKVPSQADLDAASATLKRSEAAAASAAAAVNQWRAAVGVDETNIELSSIRSPIDGIVLSRQIEPGQTVAAMMQAPVLFTLAENLTQMKLEVDVDEADVGQVQKGQQATFTVDAWPGRAYPSEITRVGYGSQEQDGVISYKTVLTVNNDDLSLRPGMTATAEITTQRRENVLLAPNAALRFAPPPEPADAQPKTSIVGSLVPRPPRGTQPGANRDAGSGAQRVWILRKAAPVAVPVRTGASDGTLTEVSGEALQEGMQVITERVEKAP
jgi:HlyD family secretion protein